MRQLVFLPLLALTGCFQWNPAASLPDGGPPEVYPDPVSSLPDGGAATWYRDVLPIAQLRCQGCHTQGGIAPFSMDSYDGVKNWAPQMATDVQIRKMPPWMPADSCGMTYRDSRKLSQREVDVFNAWAANHGAAGDPADAPAPVQPAALDWVDTTMVPAASYTPSATLTDDYHCFILDPALSTAKSVIGYQVAPGVRAQVHHVLLYSVDKAQAQAADDAEPGEGWTCFGGSGISKAETIGGWVPGTDFVKYPEGTGIPLAPGKVLAMQIHYNTSAGVRAPDSTTIKFQYARTAVTPAVLIPLLDASFSIPPNAMGYTPVTQPKGFPNVLGLDVRVWGVLPHMHTRGARIAVTGPSGCYVDIQNWDFHWQQQYFFDAPVTVKQGQSTFLSCTWNNPTNKTVRWGEGTDDEMCLAYLYATQ